MLKRSHVFVVGVLALAAMAVASPTFAADCKKVYGAGATELRLATGSPGELGLVEALAAKFNKNHDTKVCWKKAGSGKSLKLLKGKEVDLVMVHAPAAEKKAVKEGWAANRTLIGSNEFFIVGPADDPAGIAKAESAADAYKKIAETKAKFFSRGDNSGTHKKEMSIWKKAGIEPKGDWYVITKDFMRATLRRANKEHGYFMTDSSTWFTDQDNLKDLKVLFKGDPYLVNTYHALSQPKGATPAAELAAEFVKFLGSAEGQKLIADYGKKQYGRPIYNDAEYAKKYDH